MKAGFLALILFLNSFGLEMAYAQSVSGLGFPDSIDSDFLFKEDFFPYKPHDMISEDTRISLTNVYVFTEKSLGFDVAYEPDRDFMYLKSRVLFTEDHWIKLPGQIVRERIGGEGKSRDEGEIESEEKWNFPEGTILVHCLYFAEVPERLMECRFEKKTASGWKYAQYSPASDHPGKLFLAMFPEGQYIAYEFKHPTKGNLLIKAMALSPRNCITCHAFHGTDPSPCAFKPGEMSLTSPWIEEFNKKYGFLPFKN